MLAAKQRVSARIIEKSAGGPDSLCFFCPQTVKTGHVERRFVLRVVGAAQGHDEST